MAIYLILKLQGPLQAWGGHTYEDYRSSMDFPSRSGLLGLLSACLGIKRDDKPSLLSLSSSLMFAVRKDDSIIPATRLTDFHTVEHARKVDGKANPNPVVSRREYLCDVQFTVAVQVLEDSPFSYAEIKESLACPRYTPFLGRRCCPPSRPLFEAEVDAPSMTVALKKVAPYSGVIYSDVDEDSDAQLMVRDVPLRRHRQFGSRRVYIKTEVANVSE